MAARDWHKGQLLVAWISAAAILAGAHLTYRAWETHHRELHESSMEMLDLLETKRRMYPEQKRAADSGWNLVFFDDLGRSLRHADRRRSWRSVLLLLDAGVLMSMLAVSWRWYGAQRKLKPISTS